jgi:hypothetical protein
MQPWTLGSPAMMGQFPATALIYRKGLIKTGDTLVKVKLSTNDLLQLKGTPLPQDAALDELRLKDVPAGGELKAGQRIDPLVHYAGRTEVWFDSGATETRMGDLRKLIDHEKRFVISSTGELKLDYGKGILTINAPEAQGGSGNLAAEGLIETADLKIRCPLDVAHILVVAVDGKPIGHSAKMLLQLMSEEQNSGFQAEEISPGTKKITKLGSDPWEVKRLAGNVEFKNGPVSLAPLDYNGYPARKEIVGKSFDLLPDTIYYLVTRPK